MGQHKRLPRPRWFGPERYAWLTRPSTQKPDWEAGEPGRWLKALKHCRDLEHMSRGELREKLDYTGDVARIRAEFIRRRRKGGLTRSQQHRQERECTVHYIRAAFPTDGSPPMSSLADLPAMPIVEAVEPGDLWTFGASLTLRINLDAPDNEILAAIKRELARARENYPDNSPMRTGRIESRQFAPSTFDKWRAKKIVQVAELMWWARQMPRRLRPSQVQLGRWVFDGASDNHPERQFAQARKILSAALATYPALLVQVEGKTTI